MSRKLKNEELHRLSMEEFTQAAKKPIVVVLDNVRSLHNVGSVFRSADAFLIDEILLCGLTGCPPNKEIEKTALGATNTVKWQYFDSTQKAIDYLKSKKIPVYAVEQAENSIPLNKMPFPKACALVFGNEVYGVEQDIVDICDGVIEIPQLGSKHSLNISVSAGIVLWEVLRGDL
ncbi:MAG: RNA methyltransferase [Bacteroidota bacterium]